MAPYMFMKMISEGVEINQFGDGTSYRDYTYVGDIVNGIESIIKGNGKWGDIYNLGNESPITLNNFIELCEKIVGKKAKKNIIENQKGDVPRTYADISKAKQDLKYNPEIKLEEGLMKMYEWMKLNNRISI